MLVLVAACSSAGGGSSVADYVAGRWTCRFTAKATIQAPGAGQTTLDVTGNVTVTDATRGRVVIDFPRGGPPGARGSWRLTDERLVVRWDHGRLGPTTATHVSLAAHQFRIRGDTAEPTRRGQWVDVTMDRASRKVRFAFTMPDGGGPGTLVCAKT